MRHCQPGSGTALPYDAPQLNLSKPIVFTWNFTLRSSLNGLESNVMRATTRVRGLFEVGEAETPIGRSLLTEQFRILTNQIPVLYAVLLLDSISVGFVLP